MITVDPKAPTDEERRIRTVTKPRLNLKLMYIKPYKVSPYCDGAEGGVPGGGKWGGKA